MNNAPIGVIDSGSGGLTILRSLQTLLPSESFYYVGDHKYNPYGGKTRAFIRSRIVSIIHFLRSKQCKLIVVACNTATIAGINYFRNQFPDVPIVGVVPVIKTAALLSKTRHVVVLSTQYTAKSSYQKKLIHDWAGDCTVASIGSSKLVPLIEMGKSDRKEIHKELHTILNRVPSGSFDVVVLGCTHYPFIRETIQKIVGEKVTIIDSSDAVGRQVERILNARSDRSNGIGKTIYGTTGEVKTVALVYKKLLTKKITVSHVTV